MKRGDRVKVTRDSGWRATFGDAVGTVEDASETDKLAWVFFPGIGYAQGWAWDTFEVVEAAREDVLEMAECGCSDEG